MGRRHHYIPRVLLKRFSSRCLDQKDKYLIWQCSQNKVAIEISTRDAAVSKDFYGEDNEIEDKLGIFEGRLGTALSGIESGESADKYRDTMREFIWLQSMRTKAFRAHLTSTFRSIFLQFGESAKSVDLIGHLSKKVEENFEEFLEEQIKQLAPMEQLVFRSMITVPMFRQIALEVMIRHMTLVDIKTVLARMLERLADSGLVKEALDKQINKGLLSSIDEKHVPVRFFPLSWHVNKYPENSLVLGDMCVFAIGSDNSIGSIVRLADTWKYIMIPISHSNLLVASRDQTNMILEPEHINTYSAGLSSQFVFSSVSDASTALICKYIGTIEPFISQDEILDMVGNVWGSDFLDINKGGK